MSNIDQNSEHSSPAVLYRFGDFTLNLGRGTLSRGAVPVKLRPKSFKLLHHFLDHSGELISKTQLHDAVWGHTVVTDDAITQCIIDIRRAIGDKQQKTLKTVPRRGYIFDAPVTRHDGGVERHAIVEKTAWMWATVLAVVVAAVVMIWWRPFSTSVVPPQPEFSIAVLPFADMSADGDLGYFADGMAEEILNVLAQSTQLRVIARTSSFSFRNEETDVAGIADRLDVTHVLEGSVRDNGEQIRVTAQLVEAQTGGHLWSQTYDRTLAEIFQVQDDISAQVASRLTAILIPSGDRQGDADPLAYRLYLQARHVLDSGSSDDQKNAFQLLNQALDIEPEYGPAWRELSRIQWRQLGRQGDFERAIDEMRLSMNRALAFSPDDAGILAYMGWHQADFDADLIAAVRFFDRALTMNRNQEDLLRTATLMSLALGQIDDAVKLAERTIDQNPLCGICLLNLSEAYLMQGNLAQAELTLRNFQSLGQGGHTSLGQTLLVAGKPLEAIAAFERESIESYRLAGIAMARHSLGPDETSAKALSDYLATLSLDHRHNPALALAWIGQFDEAFAALEQFVQSAQVTVGDRIVRHNLINIGIALRNPLLSGLHDDPRWDLLLKRLGLSSSQLEGLRLDLSTLG